MGIGVRESINIYILKSALRGKIPINNFIVANNRVIYYNDYMTQNIAETREEERQALASLAISYGISQIKTNGYYFDRIYQWNDDINDLELISEKAVIRVLGKTAKVPIGEDKEYKTFEEAHEATKKYWSEYYRVVREKRRGANTSESERVKQRKRQASYRERLKEKEQGIARNQ